MTLRFESKPKAVRADETCPICSTLPITLLIAIGCLHSSLRLAVSATALGALPTGRVRPYCSHSQPWYAFPKAALGTPASLSVHHGQTA
jgi:hypothetical protein